ncbi:UdgX family uracil-DNA binding protein [Microbacterium sp. STN6]|uniref:UdgX family uracil-DNA binding protein n=1 Tax=Microbacterium sp. STN6 TaxID=2995588 RepID=UPI002260D248|nr:UdgX family uracil-DNA binding protein [Microbacterium sp. STN6]MCX7523310.1 UdgX family uracil-DNA binding protein [Microbacterium sp. STN6]
MADEERPGAQLWVPDKHTVSALREAAPDCRGCELWKNATQVVFGVGSPRARLMLVGEQPGDREDREGEPFIGPAARVLDDALDAAGIDRDDVYLTNAVKHFRFSPASRGKRRIHEKPAVAHIEACHPWLAAELDAVTPRLVVALGATAARSLLGRTVRITAERGHVIEGPATHAGEPTRVLVTTHPSALLRLKGHGGWDEAFDAFVADLEAARAHLG